MIQINNNQIIILILLIIVLLTISYKLYIKKCDKIENFESILLKLNKKTNKSKNKSKTKGKKKEKFSNMPKIPNFMDEITNYNKSFKKEKFKNNSKSTAESFGKFAFYK